MHTYRNTTHLNIIPKVGDITDKGCVLLIDKKGKLLMDKRGQGFLRPFAVNLVVWQRTAE